MLVACGLLIPLVGSAETLVFAPLPMENPDAVARQWKPVLDYLGNALGARLNVEYSGDYAVILEKLRAGKLDLAYLGPLPYVALRDDFPAATPVVHFNEMSGQPSYTCAIAVLEERRLSAKDLRGRRIALTQPLSTCGYLATDGLLREAGGSLEKNSYRYLDKHDAVAIAVARGDFDAGGLKTVIARKYAHLGLKVIAESQPLPSFALIANGQRVSAARIAEIRAALSGADQNQRAMWGDSLRYGVVPAADSDYDVVRALRGRTAIPEKDNY